MRISKKRTANLVLAASTLVLGSLGTGCELIVDFNRALIEAGADAPFAFVDAGDASITDAVSNADAIVVPDAVTDVVYVEGATDAHHAVDASTDARHDGGVDARGDSTTKDGGAVPDAAHVDSKAPSDANSDTRA